MATPIIALTTAKSNYYCGEWKVSETLFQQITAVVRMMRSIEFCFVRKTPN